MTTEVEVTDEHVRLFTEAWEAKRKEIGRGIAPKGTKTRAGLRAVFESFPVAFAEVEEQAE